MGKPEEPYQEIIVETYYESGSGLHGNPIHSATGRRVIEIVLKRNILAAWRAAEPLLETKAKC